ncbi:uncharacterized protein PSANT_06978 [Moesziomyces antarcticus]|uniref:Protein kinase domain-containing protein n=1 Tax=Pseudozyma antarctica TaxID=84753 RepID=A0A5C3G0G9_PSEA2|nr:uncharacterized protein PSANT_06978 [Moesziomyces antarcticus]
MTRSGMMYEATRVLGEGAFGQVYEATTAGSKTPVAIKMIRSSGLVHSQVAREEIRIHRTISHDAVVRFVEAWTEPGRVFIVLELCSATLADYIGFLHSPRSWTQEQQSGLFERVRPERLALQIIFALHYLHTSQKLRRAILHRDLKPENILIHGSGIAKVSDFGLACVIDRGTKARMGIAGTPGFRSPEMLNGLPYGTATDIWSLGNLLWELFTGIPLHRELQSGSSKYNVRVNVRSGKGVFHLRSAIDRMLSRKDEARPSTNDLLSDAAILDSLFHLWRTERILVRTRACLYLLVSNMRLIMKADRDSGMTQQSHPSSLRTAIPLQAALPRCFASATSSLV